MSTVTIRAVGDIRPNRDDPESLLATAAPALRAADIAFGQLETTFSERGTVQLHVPVMARDSTRVHPRQAAAVTSAGLDIVSVAGNLCMAWGEEALLDTIDLLGRHGVATVGAGPDLATARKPVILERNGVRVAFLAYCSVLPPGTAATASQAGCTPIRVTTSYEQVDWQAGCPPRVISVADPGDLAAMRADIAAARELADVVAVSMHWGIHFIPAIIAMYQREVGRAAIDAGADVVFGHHAHILKGIEVYRGRTIFYSLGNIGFDMPYEAAAKREHLKGLIELELDPEYPTYGYPTDSRKTVIATCEVVDGAVRRVGFLPAMINKLGQPEVLERTDPRADEVVEYLRWCNREAGLDTTLTWDGDEVLVGAAE